MPLTSSLSQLRPLTQPSFQQGAITQPSFGTENAFGATVQTPGVNPNQISGPAAGTGIIGPQTGGVRPPPFAPPPPGINPPPQPGINPPTGGFAGGQSGPLIPNQPGFPGGGQSAPFNPTGGIIPPGFPFDDPIKGGGAGPPKQPINPNVQQFGQTQFGLAASERARLQGANAGAGAFQQGSQQGQQTLLAGFNQGQQFLNQGVNALGGNFGVTAGQGSATDVDPITGQPLFQQGAQQSGQFIGGGVQAQQQALALSGALGQEAFDQARIDNPQLRLLEERGRLNLENSTAASGGLGSGQFQIELQQLGQAQAAQDIQRQIQNAQGLTQQGIQAAGQSGQLLGQAGAQQGRLAGQNAAQRTQASLSNAAQRTQASQASASNALGAAQGQAGLFGQGANLAGQLATTGAGLQAQTGRDIGQLLAGTAGQVATDRFTAGQDIAGNVGTTTQGLSNLQNQEGQQISDLLGQFGANAGNLMQASAQAASAGNQQLATLLANLATGQGSDLGGIALAGGQTQAGQALASGANNQATIDALLAAFGQGGGG